MLSSGNGYALRSKSANSLLELDLDYFYTGQREIDGIMSDIFVAKTDISQQIEVVNEYFFTPVILKFYNLTKLKKSLRIILQHKIIIKKTKFQGG